MTIVVTGLGAVSALGASAPATFERLVRGERGFGELTLFDAEGYRTRVVGQVRDVALPVPEGDGPRGDASRTSELALVAAREAVLGAELPRGGLRVGLVVGGTTAGMLETESLLSVLVSPDGEVDAAARKEALARMLSHPLSAPTDRVARELAHVTRVRSLSSACSSGANALVVGATWLELDLVDAVVCGAADALCRVTLSGFGALGALDPDGARPFDRRRRGLTLGEGAGFLVLERAADARARGKSPICSLLGWSSQSEAHHITNPEPEGDAPTRAMLSAMARAGLSPADIDYVDAHGTGTPLNDPMEARAIARALGREAERIPVSSQKGQIGHTLAAAGAIEAAVTALAIARSVIPPTGGLEEPDPACPLVHVTRALERPLRAALSSSFGFGGMDAVLVLGGPSAEAPPSRARARVVVTGVATVTPAGLHVGEEVADLPLSAASGLVVGADVAELDMERGRRLDRASRLAAVAVEGALAGASPDERRSAMGVVLGSAFGAVDATAAFMRRLRDRGPRLVSPADFPSLVPNSPAGHVSIYHRLLGPSLVVADLAASGEAAVAQAWELLASSQVDGVVACAVEARSNIVEQVLAELFAEARVGEERSPTGVPESRGARGEGASAVLLERADVARAAGAPALAEVIEVRVFGDDLAALATLPPPPHGAVLVSAEPSSRARALVARSPWAATPALSWASRVGAHEAMGGVAIAVAAAVIARGAARAALCVGTARGRGYALVLARPEDGTACPP